MSTTNIFQIMDNPNTETLASLSAHANQVAKATLTQARDLWGKEGKKAVKNSNKQDINRGARSNRAANVIRPTYFKNSHRH